MDLNELMSSVSKAIALLPLVPLTPAPSSGLAAPPATLVPQFPTPPKPSTPYEFDMKRTTKHAVKRLTKFGDILKENPDSYELESRLIVHPSNSHKISPNIPVVLFDKILNFFTLNARHYKFMPWYYTVDHFFADNVRMRKTWPKAQSGGGDEKAAPKATVSWAKKRLIENSDWNIDGRPLSMRISLKLEKKITPPDNGAATPTFIQSKQTCSFQDKAVTVFFSYVWQGETEYQTRVSIPSYSIEVEVNNSAIAPSTLPEEVVYNLLTRTLELQGLNSPLSLSEVK